MISNHIGGDIFFLLLILRDVTIGNTPASTFISSLFVANETNYLKMKCMINSLMFLIWFYQWADVSCRDYSIEIKTSAPAVQGANVTFEAFLRYENGDTPPPEKLEWVM